MAREGIYVDGKKIIARYVGDKKVWERAREKLFGTWNYDQAWSSSYVDYTQYIAETSFYLETSQTDDIEVEITRVSIGEQSWKAKTFGIYIGDKVGNRKRITLRISFPSSLAKYYFINATRLNVPGEIEIYKEND